jgi:membrane protease subunit (stomatin/prohibitin family)
LGAAVIGGAAYHIGKKGQQSRDQQAQIDDMQQEQQQQQYQQAPPQAAPAPEEDPMDKLTQLKSLLDQGVLTQAEFDVQKTKILQSM